MDIKIFARSQFLILLQQNVQETEVHSYQHDNGCSRQTTCKYTSLCSHTVLWKSTI